VAEAINCRHLRTQLVAKDSEAEYRECLDCGAILDVEESKENARTPAKTNEGFDDSLSDA
jgi:hypothetical protein